MSAISVNWLDDERRAADVEQGAVELALLVLEDPQPGDLAGQAVGVRLDVAAATPRSTHRPAPISPPGVDAHPRHPLHDRSQAAEYYSVGSSRSRMRDS